MKYEDLKILEELRAKGSVTEEEYQQEKAKILNNNEYSSSSQNPLGGMDESTYLALMHLSQFGGFILPLLGFILPILMWLSNKNVNANVDRHGKNILNFIISYMIYSCISGILILLFIGIPLLIILCIMQFTFIILAAIKAGKGEYWEYPLTIKFFS